MKTVSQILREERLRQGLSILRVEKETKIKRRFLEAIESGNYKVLPSESYAIGFVKNYASYLNVDPYKINRMFRREYESEQQKILPTFKISKLTFLQRLFFTPKIILILLLLILIGGYLAYQYSSFFFPPRLAVTSPQENSRASGNIIEITGETDPYASVTINDDETYVNLDGSFKKTLYLFSGNQKITVVSKNRNGKEAVKTITVIIP